MARMIYKYKDYYFESDDRTVMVTQAEYFLFVDKCRKVIEEDGANNVAKRKELLGN